MDYSIYLCLDKQKYLTMKKEIGKWLMDIAKYVVTGGIISTFISNYQQQSWIIYINAAICCYNLLFGRVPAILRKEKGLKTVKKGGNSYGTLFILL